MSRLSLQQQVSNDKHFYAEIASAIQQFLNFLQQRNQQLAKFAEVYALQKRTENKHVVLDEPVQQEVQPAEAEETNQENELPGLLVAQFLAAFIALQKEILLSIAQAFQDGEISSGTATQLKQVVRNVVQPQAIIPQIQQRFVELSDPTPSAPPLEENDPVIQAMPLPYREQATVLRKQVVPSAPPHQRAQAVVESVLYDALVRETVKTAPAENENYHNEAARFFKSHQYNNSQGLIQRFTEAFQPMLFELYSSQNRNGNSLYKTPYPLFNTCNAEFLAQLSQEEKNDLLSFTT